MNNNNSQTSNTLFIEEVLLTRRKRHELLLLMSGLSILDRDILVMKFILGSSAEEIAINTGLVLSTVEKKIDRALEKLSLK